MTREDQFSRLVLAAEPRPFWLDQPGAPPAGNLCVARRPRTWW